MLTKSSHILKFRSNIWFFKCDTIKGTVNIIDNESCNRQTLSLKQACNIIPVVPENADMLVYPISNITYIVRVIKHQWRRRRINMKYIGHDNGRIFFEKHYNLYTWSTSASGGMRLVLDPIDLPGKQMINEIFWNRMSTYENMKFHISATKLHIYSRDLCEDYDLGSRKAVAQYNHGLMPVGPYSIISGVPYCKFDINDLSNLPPTTRQLILTTLLCLKFSHNGYMKFMPKIIFRHKVIPLLLDLTDLSQYMLTSTDLDLY